MAAKPEFQSQGACVLRGAVSLDWIERLRAGVERNMAAPGPWSKHYQQPGEPGHFFGDYCNWDRIDEYREFLLDSPIGSLAADVMRSTRAFLFHEHVLVKEPGTVSRTPWHHDMPYYCVDGHQCVSFWIPLDPVAKQVCPVWISGSHRWGRLFLPQKFDPTKRYDHDEAVYDEMPDFDAAPDDYEFLSWDLEPGDVVAFHFLTVHGAPGNPLAERRRAFAARFLGDDMRYARRPGETSPPFPTVKAAPGDRMPEDVCPQVWPR